MLAILSRRPAPLSSTSVVVCLVLPTVLFLVMVGVLVLLLFGAITTHQYLDIYAVVLLVGFVAFFSLLLSGVETDAILEIVRGRRVGVMLYVFLLMMLGVGMPRIFGFFF